jgi:polysaccharide export outer membrane protein
MGARSVGGARIQRLRLLGLGLIVASLAACGTSSVDDVSMATGAISSSAATSSNTQKTSFAADGSVVSQGDKVASDGDAKRQLRAVVKQAVEANKAGASAYQIGPQDVLDVAVFKVPDLSKTVQVSEAGTINYPLIGETAAAGKTAREIEQDLTAKLGAKYLQNPQVTVMVKEFNSQRVTIEGAVKKPGIYPLRGGMTLLQLIASAQGLTDVAEDDAVVLRQENGRQKAARFALSEIRSAGAEDLPLQAGDVVIVNTSMTKEAFNTVVKAMPLARFFFLF